MARNGPKCTASDCTRSLACCSSPPPGLTDPVICRVSLLLVLVLPAGYCGCHSPTAPGILHLAGHRVGMILPMLVGREEGEMVGLEVGMESVSCCVWPCRAVKPLGASSGEQLLKRGCPHDRADISTHRWLLGEVYSCS